MVRRDIQVESGRYRVQKETTDPAFVRLRIQEGINDHVRYVAGRPPTSTVTTRNDVGPDSADDVPVYEAAISADTAKAFGIELGETVPLVGDPGDQLIGRTGTDQLAFATITGIYEATDPGSDWWLNDPQLIHPVIRALSLEVQLLDAALLVDPGTHAALATYASPSGQGLRYSWREFLDPERLSDRTLAGLITDFHRLLVAYPSANVTPATDTALRTGMATMLEAHQARWAAAEGIIAVMALGPALVAVATLGLIAVLAARRRQATMALARSRGASGRQVLVPAVVEGLLIAVPGAILAAAIAVALVPEAVLSPTIVAAAAVVAIAVTVVTATVAPVVGSRGPARARMTAWWAVSAPAARGRRVGRRARGRRGVPAARTRPARCELGRRGGRLRPAIAAVPVLVGVAAGIVVVRLYPIALRGVAAVARRGRGLVLDAGRPAGDRRRRLIGRAAGPARDRDRRRIRRRVAGQPRHGRRRGGLAVRRRRATASRRRTARSRATSTQRRCRGSRPSPTCSRAARRSTAATGHSRCSPSRIRGPMATALAGTPADPQFPTGFATPAPGPIPAIISTELAESPRGVKLGEEFQASVQGFNLTYRVAEVATASPGCRAAGLGSSRRASGSWPRPRRPGSCPIWSIVDAPTTTPRRLARRRDRDVAVGRDHQPGRGRRRRCARRP